MRQGRKAQRAGQRQALIGTRRIHLSHQRGQASVWLLLRKRLQFGPEGALKRNRSRVTGKPKGTLCQMARHPSPETIELIEDLFTGGKGLQVSRSTIASICLGESREDKP
jgi:hypothetical protein